MASLFDRDQPNWHEMKKDDCLSFIKGRLQITLGYLKELERTAVQRKVLKLYQDGLEVVLVSVLVWLTDIRTLEVLSFVKYN